MPFKTNRFSTPEYTCQLNGGVSGLWHRHRAESRAGKATHCIDSLILPPKKSATHYTESTKVSAETFALNMLGVHLWWWGEAPLPATDGGPHGKSTFHSHAIPRRVACARRSGTRGPVCDGLGCVPQIVTPGPQMVTLLGSGVAADVQSY